MENRTKLRTAYLIRTSDGAKATRRGELQIELAIAAGYEEVKTPVQSLAEKAPVVEEDLTEAPQTDEAAEAEAPAAKAAPKVSKATKKAKD